MSAARVLAYRRHARERPTGLGVWYDRALTTTICSAVAAGVGVAAFSGGQAHPDHVVVFATLVAVVLFAAITKVLVWLGPIVVRSAEYAWLLSAPIDRGALLRGRLAWLLVGGASAGFAIATGWVAVAHPVGLSAAVAAGTGIALGVLVAAIAVVAQPDRSTLLDRAASVVIGACCGLAVLAETLTRPEPVLWIGIGLAVAAVVAAAMALARLGRLHRATLAAGAEIADATVTAVSWLEPSLLSATIVARRMRNLGRVRSVALRGPRFAAFVHADLTRLLRVPVNLVLWAGIAVLPYAVNAVASPTVLVVVHLIGACLATDRLASGLRTVARTDSLRRMLGGTDVTLIAPHLVVPAVGAVVWALVSAPLIPALSVLVSAVGAVAVVLRFATRPLMEYDGALIATPLGMIPSNLLRRLMTGPGLLGALVLVQVLIVR